MDITSSSLSMNIGGIQMRNPVMTASGTFGYGSEYADFVDLNQLGAVVVKGVTSAPWPGNPMQRIMETPSGMLNAIGLQNVGVDGFISEKLPYLRNFDVPVIVNVCGKTVEEYLIVIEKLNDASGIAGVELNISCPNLDCGGMSFGVDANLAHQLVKEVRAITHLPLLVKLSPNVTDITVIARAVENAGANALSAINTLLGMAINAETRKPELANVTGGLSGPAIKPVALRLVWEVYKNVSIPIIGMGGIMTATDAVEFFIAGASAVAVGTANFVNPQASMEVVKGIHTYLKKANIRSVKELVGSLKVG
ncbi:MAG: dihydroorotate dehydrogenase [Candidatus Poribacteria bacterium]|nr:dihydroorotate dehydrogenase [Candidatus Poribacteria bacterium]